MLFSFSRRNSFVRHFCRILNEISLQATNNTVSSSLKQKRRQKRSRRLRYSSFSIRTIRIRGNNTLFAVFNELKELRRIGKFRKFVSRFVGIVSTVCERDIPALLFGVVVLIDQLRDTYEYSVLLFCLPFARPSLPFLISLSYCTFRRIQ